MKTMGKAIVTAAVAAAIVLPLLILKGCGSQWDGVSVRLQLTSSGGAPVQQLALPPGVTHISFNISGPGMDTVTRLVYVLGATSVSESFDIKPGADRTFRAEALDRAGAAIWNGATTVNIGDQPVTVPIEMLFLQYSDTLPPSAPSISTATSDEPGTYTLIWLPSEDNNTVAGYYVYEVVDGELFLVDSVTVTTITESGLLGGTYCFAISAIDPAGNESDISEITCIEVDGTADTQDPGAPQNFSATGISDAEIALAWEAPAAMDNIAGYNIYNSGGAVRYVSSSTGTSLTEVRLEGGTYCYNATTVDEAANESGAAGPVCVTIAGVLTGPAGDVTSPTVPSAPVLNTVSETGVEMAWTPSSDDNAVAGYNIYEDDGDALQYRTSSIANTAALERLSPGYYCFALSAVDLSGNESATGEASCILVGGSAYDPRVPNCPEFLTYMENPGGQYHWHPDSNPPRCYGELPSPPKTWWRTPPGQDK